MGKLEETQAIIKIIGNTTLSVIGYVPEGGRAWSAGTFILMRTNIDAIAPFTVIGSAQPMQMSAEGTKQKISSYHSNAYFSSKSIITYGYFREKIPSRN